MKCEIGDYIHGAVGLYRVADRGPESVTLELVVPFEEATEDEAESNAGVVQLSVLDSYGSRIPQEEYEDVSVSDGDTLRWETGTKSGDPAQTVVHIDDDGVELESDGLFVPESFGHVEQLRGNIALGVAEIIQDEV